MFKRALNAKRLRSSSATRELWAVLCVTHFPAERRDLLAEFVAPLPILFASYLLALFYKLCHSVWNGDLSLSFKIQNSVNPFPPFQPCACRCRVHFVLIHCTVRFTNRFEQKPERSRNVKIVIQRVFKLCGWALGVCLFRNFAQTRQPIIDSG